MGRPSNTKERRAQIVSVFALVLARGGYRRASISAIAAEANLTSGLIHYHFRHKKEILLSLVENLVEELEARLAADARPHRLDALIDSLLAVDGGDAVSTACWQWIGAEAGHIPEIQTAYTSALRQLEGRLRAAFVDLNADAPDMAARSVLLAIEGAWRVAHGAPTLWASGSAAPTIRALARSLSQ